jgi:hypothetical protein
MGYNICSCGSKKGTSSLMCQRCRKANPFPPSRLRTVNGNRQCNICKAVYPATTEFFRARDNHLLRGECLSCEKEYKLKYKHCNKHRWDNSPKRISGIRRRALKVYDMTQNQWDTLARQQEYKCKICNRLCQPTHQISRTPVCSIDKLVTDHNHKTGKLRGLICGLCNCGLGNFKDNPDILRKAALYLEEHANENRTASP